ncbi:MAG TPA: hypothetical protein VHY08_01910 [Bacillota bacterium]|nr:hypothetical protein [Bacillota bacterium]
MNSIFGYERTTRGLNISLWVSPYDGDVQVLYRLAELFAETETAIAGVDGCHGRYPLLLITKDI